MKHKVMKSLNKNTKYSRPIKTEAMEGTCTYGGDKKYITKILARKSEKITCKIYERTIFR
jgi:hypothetical protein